jgi:hypothetical protein
MLSLNRSTSVSVFAAFVAFASGCATEAPKEADKIAAETSALQVLDCQAQAATCLGLLPTPAKILSCRKNVEACIDGAAADVEMTVSSVVDCNTAALDCAKGVKKLSDARACREAYTTCTADIVDGITADIIDAVDLPATSDIINLPGTAGAVQDCVDDTSACVLKAGVNADKQLVCADSLTECATDVAKNLKLDLPASSEIIDLPGTAGEAQACADDAVACVTAAGANIGKVLACRTSFENCSIAVVDNIDLPKVGEVVDGATAAVDCASEAADCLSSAGLSVTKVNECRKGFQTCTLDAVGSVL